MDFLRINCIGTYDIIQPDTLGAIETTPRNFGIVNFNDIYGNSCSIQESSLATDNALWIGVDENRMHINIPLAIKIMGTLKTFINNGVLL